MDCDHEKIVTDSEGDDLCAACGLAFYYCAPCTDFSENAVYHAEPLCARYDSPESR